MAGLNPQFVRRQVLPCALFIDLLEAQNFGNSEALSGHPTMPNIPPGAGLTRGT